MPALFDLPNEVSFLCPGNGCNDTDVTQILIHVLLPIPTDLLLQLIPVSHRFQNLVLRIVHARLLVAASLEDRKLILECYHPSAQYTEPYLFCDYLGTPGLSDKVEGQGWIYEASEKDNRLGRLRGLYSRFRPQRPEADPPFRSHPAGDVPGSRTYYDGPLSKPTKSIELVSQTMNLDSHELFSQLCVSVNLVQVGPRRGVFLSCVDVLRKTTPRIWRDWLAEGAQSPDGPSIKPTDLENECQYRRIIWADNARNIGIRAHVKEQRWRRHESILIHKDEDQAVSYSLELEGGKTSSFLRLPTDLHCESDFTAKRILNGDKFYLCFLQWSQANVSRTARAYHSCSLGCREITARNQRQFEQGHGIRILCQQRRRNSVKTFY